MEMNDEIRIEPDQVVLALQVSVHIGVARGRIQRDDGVVHLHMEPAENPPVGLFCAVTADRHVGQFSVETVEYAAGA